LNTIEAYEEFLERFPDAAQVSKAMRNRNRLAFEKVKSQNTVEAYVAYLLTYPESEYLQSVIKLRNAAAFANAKKVNSLEAYESFIKNYPDALEVAEAKARQQDLLYQKAKTVNSLQAFNEFIKKYPEGKYFIDIFNLKATELGNQFVHKNNFFNPSLLWVKGFDNNGYIESGGIIAGTPNGDYVLACTTRETDTSYADAWIIKLDASGKMLWNKTVGQAYEEEVNHILIDSRGDIIVLGSTWLSSDSASKMGWMFKLGSDGKKIWNKNLGKIDIRACALTMDDRIYIAGFIKKDTLGNHYAFTVFNNIAQKVGERVYTGFGEFNDMIFTQEGDIFFCGSNWLALLDEKRYLKWDDTIDPAYTVTHCTSSGTGGFYIAGYNKSKVFYSGYSVNGKKTWFQSQDKSDTTELIADIATVSPGNLLVIEQLGSGSKIKLFSSNGALLQTKDLYNNLKGEVILTNNPQAVLVLNDGDLIVVKYSQISAL
jgi:hypothetical protein